VRTADISQRPFRNELRLTLVEELEILLFEGAHGASLRIAHHHRYQHQVYFRFEGDGGLASV